MILLYFNFYKKKYSKVNKEKFISNLILLYRYINLEKKDFSF